MKNTELSRLLEEAADLLELQGANSFRVRAYRSAAQTLLQLTSPVEDVRGTPGKSLTDLPGVGKDMAQKIADAIDTGTFPLLEELRAEFPATMLQLLRLPGLGPKKAAQLYRELQIHSLDDLQQAAEAGRIAAVKGFGKKSEQALLESLARYRSLGDAPDRFLLATAKAAADQLADDLRRLPEVDQIEVAGSCRRRKETCGDLDLLATARNSAAVMQALSAHPLVAETLSGGETKQRVRLTTGIELDLRVVPPESFGAALQYFTGSKEHNVSLRRRAQERGLRLNEYGLFEGERLVAGRTEQEVYAALGLQWTPPELREGREEIDLAIANRLPELIKLEDLRGDLHMHTTASDGTATIAEMIEAAQARGLEYIAITDHSQRVSMANGLNAERLRRHWDEIRRIREQFSGIHVLCGIECDILEDATLDLPDDVLAEADWVLAVLHYGLKQPREQIMRRLLNAVQSPFVHAIGHPTGRMIGRRAGADIDMPELIAAAQEHGVWLEINANPHRLDLDDLNARAARDRGVPIVISTDAHSTARLDHLEFGVYQARRAGLTSKDVMNTRSWKEFDLLLRQRRQSAGV